MKLWCLSWHDPNVGASREWFSSKRGCERQAAIYLRQSLEAVKEMRAELGYEDGDICVSDNALEADDFDISQIDVPTTRDALIAFLNVNAAKELT